MKGPLLLLVYRNGAAWLTVHNAFRYGSQPLRYFHISEFSNRQLTAAFYYNTFVQEIIDIYIINPFQKGLLNGILFIT